MAPPTTIDRSIHSDHLGANEEAGKRRGMKALIFSSAMKVMKKSYKASHDVQSDTNIIDLAYSEASESSISYSCNRDDDDYTAAQDETQYITENSSASRYGVLEPCPSLYTKKRLTRMTDGKRKGRVGRRSNNERRKGNSSKELDTDSCHSQTKSSISTSSHHHKFEMLCDDDSQGEASSDGESLLKDSGSFACSSSQHSQLDHSQQSCNGSFHGDGNISYLELDLESMEASQHPSSNPKKAPARSSFRQPTMRSESLDDILISGSLHKIGGSRRRRSSLRRNPGPGLTRSKSLDLDTLEAEENKILDVVSHRIESLDMKDNENQPIPEKGNEKISRRRAYRTNSNRHAHVTAVNPSTTAQSNELVPTESPPDRQSVSRQVSSSSRPRRYCRPSREINV